ncbi:MAG TPA: hypothetical protein VF230_16595 [Acidimicrobiales bacterium]
MRRRRSTGVSFFEQVDAILDNELIYELGELIPMPPPEHGGRPRDFPNWAYVFYGALVTACRSARRVETELDSVMWEYVRERVVERFPSRPEMWLPEKPMARHHWEYVRSTYLVNDEVIGALRDRFTLGACEQAEALGLCETNGRGSLTHPDLSRMLYADGKVVTPLYRAKPGTRQVDRTTGESRPVRADPDAKLHITGSGEPAYGNKFVLVSCRANTPHGRMILNFDHVPTAGGEAQVALACIAQLAPLLAGAHGVLYDGAFRGVHLQELLHERGLLPVVPVAAAAGGRRARRPRTERTVAIERKRLGDGRVVELVARAGQLGVVELDEGGETVFVPLVRRKIDRRRNADGTWRWYGTFALPDELGGSEILVRLDTTDEDRCRKFNRTEHLRPIPPADADYRRLYPRRSDAESINRSLDDSLWLRRAHSVGARRQLVDLLGFAIAVNSVALFRARHSNDPPTQAAA